MDIKLLHQSGLLFAIFPELKDLIGVEQDPKWHPEGDVFTHTMLVVENLDAPDIELYLAALFHDIGKLTTSIKRPDGRITAYGHPRESVRMVAPILKRLKLPNKTQENVLFLIEQHMLTHSSSTKKSTVRRLVNNSNYELVEKLCKLGRADVAAASKDYTDWRRFRRYLKELSKIETKHKITSPLNGIEICEIFNIQPGPIVGDIKKIIIEHQIETGKILTKEEAIELAKIEVFKNDIIDRKTIQK